MIRNLDSQTTIASDTKIVSSRLRQAFGLMFRKPLVDEGWVFVFRKAGVWDLTNVFVFQSIDALWLDEHKRVLQICTIAPFRFVVRGVPKTRFVIELPAGAAQESDTRVGHRISW